MTTDSYAFFVGGPRDGDAVDESLLNVGPTITVTLKASPPHVAAYYSRGVPELVTTHQYHEAPRMRVGDVATFRFFFSESFGYTATSTMQKMVEMLLTAMTHRRATRF